MHSKSSINPTIKRTTDAPKRIAVYMRVSTDEQRERETIQAQRETAERYCALHGLPVVGWYADDGVSGTIPVEKRPEGRRLLTDIAAGTLDVVLIARVDRLARSLLSLLQTVDTFERAGVALVSVAESFDTGTPVGRMLLSILGSFAQFERDMIRERTMSGSARVARAGKWTGGAPPYGYRLADQRLELDPAEAETVRTIFRLYLDAESPMGTVKIGDYLNGCDVPPPGARRYTGRNPKGWTPTAVSRIIANRLYTGERAYRRTQIVRRDGEIVGKAKTPERRITVDVPGIIDGDTYEAAQRQARRNLTMARRNGRRGYLLKGMVVCGRCGYTCVGDGSHTAGQFYYRCPNASTFRGRWIAPCGGSRVRADDLEVVVWADIEEYRRNPGPVLERLAARQRAEAEAQQPRESALEDLDRTLSSKAGERARVISLIRRGVISDGEGERELADLAAEMAALQQDRDALAAREKEARAFDQQVSDAGALLAELRGVNVTDFETRRWVTERLVKRIVLGSDDEPPQGRTGPRRPTRAAITYAFDPRHSADCSTNALPGVDTSAFEDPVIMSDAALWLARQPHDYTGHILTIGELRQMGAVRPVTRISDRPHGSA